MLFQILHWNLDLYFDGLLAGLLLFWLWCGHNRRIFGSCNGLFLRFLLLHFGLSLLEVRIAVISLLIAIQPLLSIVHYFSLTALLLLGLHIIDLQQLNFDGSSCSLLLLPKSLLLLNFIPSGKPGRRLIFEVSDGRPTSISAHNVDGELLLSLVGLGGAGLQIGQVDLLNPNRRLVGSWGGGLSAGEVGEELADEVVHFLLLPGRTDILLPATVLYHSLVLLQVVEVFAVFIRQHCPLGPTESIQHPLPQPTLFLRPGVLGPATAHPLQLRNQGALLKVVRGGSSPQQSLEMPNSQEKLPQRRGLAVRLSWDGGGASIHGDSLIIVCA